MKQVGAMKMLSKEKSKVLAIERGWSVERAEGYVDGERYRRRGMRLSVYHNVGLDEYCQGFRASYYERVRKTREQDDELSGQADLALRL